VSEGTILRNFGVRHVQKLRQICIINANEIRARIISSEA